MNQRGNVAVIVITFLLAFLGASAGILLARTIAPVKPASGLSTPVSDKYDGDCTGNETEGRCADKPFVSHTPTGCPYGDSIPVDSPKCVAPVEVVAAPAIVTEPASCK